MEVRTYNTINPRYHTSEQTDWVKEKVEQHGRLTAKTIKQNNLLSEYEQKFNRKLTEGGMMSWVIHVMNPGLRKKYRDNKKASGQKAPSVKKELEVFKQSQYIAYINRRLLGFEDRTGLEGFMKENRILSEDVKLFKLLPVKVEYSVQIGS